MTPRQGDIWMAHLEPVRGSEQGGRRPVLVISGNAMNDALPIAVVVPFSSALKSYPTAVRIIPNASNGLKKETEALPFQVRTIAKSRLAKRLGVATNGELREVLRGLFLVLTN